MPINWKQLEAEFGLKGKFCDLAGISPAMWSEVRNGNRRFSQARENYVLLRLAILTNHNSQAAALEQVFTITKAMKQEIEQEFAPKGGR